MTHVKIPVVATPEEFMAATPEERAQLVRKQIDLTPERWNQRLWIDTDETPDEEWEKDAADRTVCGTAFCFAGWAVYLAGEKFIDQDYVRDEDGYRRTISQRAEELLDLQYTDHCLFDSDNDLETIDDMLAEIYG